MAAAEKVFTKLQSDPCFQGHQLSEEEITEAWLQCSQEFDDQRSKPQVQTEKTSNLSNSDVIVRQVVRKCDNPSKAEKFFDMLHRTVGQENALGRIFSEEDVTEAWLRVTDFFNE